LDECVTDRRHCGGDTMVSMCFKGKQNRLMVAGDWAVATRGQLCIFVRSTICISLFLEEPAHIYSRRMHSAISRLIHGDKERRGGRRMYILECTLQSALQVVKILQFCPLYNQTHHRVSLWETYPGDPRLSPCRTDHTTCP
jgi:hypothetical protein